MIQTNQRRDGRTWNIEGVVEHRNAGLQHVGPLIHLAVQGLPDRNPVRFGHPLHLIEGVLQPHHRCM